MAEQQRRGAKRFLILSGVCVAGVLAVYGAGWWRGHQEAQQVRVEAEAQRRSAALGEAQSSASLADLMGEVGLLKARRRLDLALMALDERNFGTAQEQLTAAGRELRDLAEAKSPPPGSNPGALSRVTQELRTARLTVGEDLAEQRRRIVGWLRDLDAQIPDRSAPQAAAPPSVEAGPARPAVSAQESAPAPTAAAPMAGTSSAVPQPAPAASSAPPAATGAATPGQPPAAPGSTPPAGASAAPTGSASAPAPAGSAPPSGTR